MADEIELDDVRVDDARHGVRHRAGAESARRLRTPLAGRHQAANLAFSLVDARRGRRAVRHAACDEAQRHIDRVRIPGRFQHVGKFIFDVAHNPAGADVLARDASRRLRRRRRSASCCCVLRDKDWREMIRVARAASRRASCSRCAPTAPASRAWDLAEVVGVRARAWDLGATSVAGFRRGARRGAPAMRRRCSSPGRSTRWAMRWRCCRCRRSAG